MNRCSMLKHIELSVSNFHLFSHCRAPRRRLRIDPEAVNSDPGGTLAARGNRGRRDALQEVSDAGRLHLQGQERPSQQG